jgi:hypothetical protein
MPPFSENEPASLFLVCRRGERGFYFKQCPQKTAEQLPWLFVGAYALYTGTAKVPMLGQVEATVREEVSEVDLKNNRWKSSSESQLQKKVFGKLD